MTRPSGPVVLSMTWHDILFAHWPLPADVVRPRVPAALELDTWEGQAWLGIVALGIRRVRPLRIPLPADQFRFAQLNVRTYVTAGGQHGVWFFSLDAAHLPSVVAARLAYRLPYRYSRGAVVRDASGEVSFDSARRHEGRASFRGRYRPVGGAFTPGAGTFDAFVLNRLSMFAPPLVGGAGRARRADIEHGPWRVQRAEASFERNTAAAANGFDLPDVAPVLHYAAEMPMLARAPGQSFG